MFRFTPIRRHHTTVPHHVPDHLTLKPFHIPISLKTLSLSRAAWQHPAAISLMAGRRRCTSTHMRPTDLPRGLELKYNEQKRSCGTGSSQSERRRAVCQPNLQVQRISVQFSQGAQCYSKTSPSWLPVPPAPLLSKQKIQHGVRSPCGTV